uniref:Uncharacterized protein n=1 Tax=viral metagenome TaxID=1070528 RepID=A0A6M3M7C6_9ZZZZ
MTAKEILDSPSPPKCPSCGETTNQHLRGFGEDYENYRCGHCDRKYSVEAKGEDVALSSQLGFKINEEEGKGDE